MTIALVARSPAPRAWSARHDSREHAIELVSVHVRVDAASVPQRDCVIGFGVSLIAYWFADADDCCVERAAGAFIGHGGDRGRGEQSAVGDVAVSGRSEPNWKPHTRPWVRRQVQHLEQAGRPSVVLGLALAPRYHVEDRRRACWRGSYQRRRADVPSRQATVSSR